MDEQNLEQGNGSFQENIESSIQKELANGNNQPASDQNIERKEEVAEQNPEEKAGENKADELIDLEVTDKEGKPVKWTMKQIKQLTKFYFDNADTIGGGLKLRQAADKNPEFKALMEKIISGSFDDKDNFNKDFAVNALKSFEAKKEVVEEKIENKTDEINEAEEALNELDPDSPQARVMRTTITSLKKARADYAGVLKQLNDYKKEIGGRVEGLETQNKQAVESKSKQEYDEEVKRVAGVFNAELGALLDSNKQGALEFADEEEKTEFEGLLRNMVASNAEEIQKLPESQQLEAFKKSISTFAKAIYDKIGKRREHWNIQYAKKKGWVKPENQEAKPKEAIKGDMTREGLEETLEKMLSEELTAKK